MPKEDPFVNRAQLLRAIKKYPEIWDSNNKLHMCRSVTAPMWNEIAEQFGGHVPTVKLQSIWSQMKYHYHNLVHRQILHKERFTTKWEHFEPMSFMYNITVAKIIGASTTNSSQSIEISNTVSSSIDEPLVMPNLHQPPQLHESAAEKGHTGDSDISWPLPNNNAVPPSINEVNIETTPYTVFTGLITPPTAPLDASGTTVTATRRLGRPNAMNNGMRARIIDCIRSHPALWVGRPTVPMPRVGGERHSQSRTSAVWKEVSSELGLTASLVQTRWSIIKQRYVDELQKERHAQFVQQGFHSNWEHFERMSFMRDTLMRKVDEREQTREHIEEIVCEQQQQQRYIRRNSNSDGGAGTNLDGLKTLPSTVTESGHILSLDAPNVGVDGVPTSVVGPLLPSASSAILGGSVVLQGSHTLYHPHALVHPTHAHSQFAQYHQNPSLQAHAAGAFVGGTRLSGGRRVKVESDLEWNPFEMILQVQGPEIAHN